MIKKIDRPLSEKESEKEKVHELFSSLKAFVSQKRKKKTEKFALLEHS